MNETILMAMLEAVMLFFMIFGLVGVKRKQDREKREEKTMEK